MAAPAIVSFGWAKSGERLQHFPYRRRRLIRPSKRCGYLFGSQWRFHSTDHIQHDGRLITPFGWEGQFLGLGLGAQDGLDTIGAMRKRANLVDLILRP